MLSNSKQFLKSLCISNTFLQNYANCDKRTGSVYLNEPPYSAHNRCELSVGNRLSWYFRYLVLSNRKTGCVFNIFFFLQHSFLPFPILKHRPNSQSNVKQHPEQPYLDTSQGHPSPSERYRKLRIMTSRYPLMTRHEIDIHDNVNGGHIKRRNATVTLLSPPITTQISSFNSFSETPAARQ